MQVMSLLSSLSRIAAVFAITLFSFASCSAGYDNKNAKSILNAMEKAVGGRAALLALKDVQFEYDYNKVSEKVRDNSIERYIFASQFSRGDYSTHEVNVIPGQKGKVVQVLNGAVPSILHEGKKLTDPKLLGGTEFLRRANFHWFAMMFRMQEPGTIHNVLPQQTVNGKTYDVVTVTYDPAVTGKPANDAYILFVNPQTHLVDQFIFSLPALGVKDPVLLFEIEYTKINGLQVMTKRKLYGTKDGKKAGAVQLIQTTSKVKFNNGFTAEKLSKEPLS